MENRKIPTKDLYTIGEVSKYTSVTNRALRYYEDIGVLLPDYIGNNGYRYYKYETMLRVPIIKYYQYMNFSLEEINKQLDVYNYKKILDTFSDSLEECNNEIKKLKNRKIVTKSWMSLIEEALLVIAEKINQVNIKYIKGQEYLCMDYDFNGNYHEAIINLEFTNFVKKNFTTIYGPVMIVFDSLEEKFNEYFPLKSTVIQRCTDSLKDKNSYWLDSGLYISKYHIGNHESIKESYEEIISYAKNSNVNLSEYVIERYVTDHWTLTNSEKFVTEILVPINK